MFCRKVQRGSHVSPPWSARVSSDANLVMPRTAFSISPAPTRRKTGWASPGRRRAVPAGYRRRHTISQVQFYNGATLLGAVATAPYSFSWDNVSAGIYGLSAKVLYDSGSTLDSTVANVTGAAGTPASGLT